MNIIHKSFHEVSFTHNNRGFHGYVTGCHEALEIIDLATKEVVTTIPTEDYYITDNVMSIVETALDSISLIEGWLNINQEEVLTEKELVNF